MVLRVVYQDDSYDMVKTSRLDEFIASGRIKKFLRSDGWVVIGRDPIRKKSELTHRGPDRRKMDRAA